MTDYTQTGEQAFIDTLPETGRFIDIGSYDGLTFSNTRSLLERGWTGVWVEPCAYAFDLAVQNAPPGVTLVNCLVGEDTGLKRFHYTRDAVSTTMAEHAKVWSSIVQFTETYVMQLSVDDLMFAFPGPYDFVSIDTEGTSLDILKLMTSYLDGTQMIVVEHGELDPAIEGFREIGRTDNNVILAR